MNFFKKEKNILNFIKYGPILFVIILSLIITFAFIQHEKRTLNEEITELKKDYLVINKQRVEYEVNSVYNYLKNEIKNSEKELKKEIKDRVYEAHSIATNIFTEESKKDVEGHIHSKKHIFQTIKNALGGIIYNNGRGYFFIADIYGNTLLQPLNKKLEGKNFLNYKDAKGYQFAKSMVDTIKNKTETYDSYFWYKGKDRVDTYKKIAFYKYFEPLNIVIGTGEYVNDFEKELKQRVLEKIRRIRFSENGYIFIYDLDGNSLSHFKKSHIGVNRIDVKDKDGNYIVKDVLNFAKKNKNGFMTYIATMKPDDIVKSREKISYIKLLEDWNWVIGSGFYLEKLNNDILKKEELLKEVNKKSIKHIAFMSLFLTIIFILISFYISKLISIRFRQYQLDIEEEIKKTIIQEKILIQQSKMATMGEMIGNIAHQWKQPLSVISSAISLVEINKELEILTDKHIDDSVYNIHMSIDNLSTTIDDFRNFFNPNKERTSFKMSDIFRKTFKLIESQFKNNEIIVIENIENIEMSGFENELLQTLINILKNAKEELVEKDKSEKRLLFVDILKKDDKVIIKIKDNANGIPIDIIDKIFDSHFTTKEQSGGTGIGLYISKQIIEESMGGILKVSNMEYEYQNEYFKGAEFTIILPLSM